MIVQIYAFTKIEEALAAAEMGVDQVGFIAGKYGIVHGELDFAEARALAAALPPTVRRVALTMSADPAEILRMAAAVEPDIVHISTEPEEVDLETMRLLRRQLPGHIGLMKAVPVDDEGSVTLALRYAAVSDLLLLDTSVKGMPGVGATGRTHDWEISRRIVELSEVPVILAGGLGADNVAEAIAAVQPWGVDSNTLTNKPGSPLEKDLARIAAFVAAARKAAPEPLAQPSRGGAKGVEGTA